MCGIAGFNFSDKKLIKSMNDAQKHRGPDGEGVYSGDEVSLGHRRLSIIDLSEEANQPMFYKDYIIIFNGEIYNFQEIKDELLKEGHKFENKSDTEVILHAYEAWGDECVNKFNGMWAFCIYNKKKSNLFISRDRYGIKPLYYYFDNEKFIFASEIKAIKQHPIELTINKKSLNFFFWQKYITSNNSIYNEINKLPPAHSLNLNLKSKELKLFEYYNIENEINSAKNVPLQERLKQIEKLTIDAVNKRLISDVPVGSFLSGGIDSSYISTIIAKNHPRFDVFTIGFKENSFNELEYAKFVADKINVKHHSQILDINEELIFDVINKLDEPFGDPSLIPTFLLSKMTRKKVTVALSGDAGDELFGGYDTYKAYKIAKFIPFFFVRIMRKVTRIIPGSDKNLHFSYKFKKFVDDYDKNINMRHLNWMSQTDIKTRKKLLSNNYTELEYQREENDLLSLQLNDFENYLSGDILKKTDVASMLNSLETRIPFLDYRIVPLVLSLPENFKIKGFNTKYLLKKLSLNVIPNKIIKRKKRGFSVPLSVWFKKSEKMKKVITDKKYYKHKLLDYDFVLKLLDSHIKGKNDNSRVLWLIFVFNLWYSNNIVLEK